jgi:hypothetical protein
MTLHNVYNLNYFITCHRILHGLYNTRNHLVDRHGKPVIHGIQSEKHCSSSNEFNVPTMLPPIPIGEVGPRANLDKVMIKRKVLADADLSI